ncbi:hypothetical protein A8B82_11000 [Sulfitobacter sp. EhC04]|uniref:hypothetical protein n=1 Tax=Sulfitobacter sp. EhC04 TaxID=1849168 RepID=UPI0007F33951|nr:hypothetical protein [Sulfitobacter sp. EhC04]OAN78255.1 hypothetical protein A8B82_11000 [Sulfitobacter sp. EhC04]
MKPDFALSLSFEGIRLLHRAAGGWRIVGEVALTTDDLNAELAVLRKSATALAPGGLRTKLLLPDAQIKYLTIDTPDLAEDARRDAARAALDGATPYAVAELAFDISLDGPRTHVAAVARETLAEAEAFAVEHRFHPVSFAAVPGNHPYLGEPFFGQTEAAAELLDDGESVEADGIAVVVIGNVTVPDGPVAAEPSPAAPAPKAPRPDTAEPPAAAADTVSKDKPEAAAKAQAPKAPPAEKTSDHSDTAAARSVPPDERPSPTEAGQSAAPRADVTAAQAPAQTQGAPTPPPPQPEAAQPAAPEGEDVTVKMPPAPVGAPAAVTPPIGAAPVIITPDAATTTSDDAQDTSADKADAAAPDKSDNPDSAGAAQDLPVMPTLRAARVEKGATAASLPPLRAEPSGFASRRSGPAKPRLEGARREPLVGAPAALPSGEDAVIRPDSSSFDTPAPTPDVAAPPAAEPAPAGGGFLSRRRKGTSAPDKRILATPAPQPGGAAVSEAERMTIFGARRAEVGGKPRFLGLVLTAVLLVFLAGVAAWASVFLDEGMSLSRLFGPRPTPEVAAVPDTPVPEQPTPETNDPVRTAALDSGLTEEDGAVLDALREPMPTVELDLSEAELEAKYAATGIWPRAPVVPLDPAGEVVIEDLYLTSIDPVSTAADAIALPALDSLLTDAALGEIASPAAAGTRFAIGANGLVIPTTSGTVSPEGVTIYLGKPDILPPDSIMARYQPQTGETAEDIPVLNVLAAFRPRTRPGGLVENAERAQFDGLTIDELAQYRPALRPQSVQEQAAEAAAPTVNPADTAEAVALALETPAQPVAFENPTQFAVAASARPDTRPRNFDRIVRRAERTAPAEETRVASAASVAPRTVAPSIPSKTSVAKQATVKNAINLRKVNLIGVYGKPSNRRALVRLSNGRYKKVVVGDRIDGGRVSAIGDAELRYTKGGRSVVLTMPRG